jgi:hypothetical protein
MRKRPIEWAPFSFQLMCFLCLFVANYWVVTDL